MPHKKQDKKLHLISLGCTKNLVDSEVMLGALCDYQITDELQEADVVIVNTCGFIEAAKTESLQTLFNAIKHKKEDALLVASGCLSERYKDELSKEIPEIDIITGVKEYDKINELLEAKRSQKPLTRQEPQKTFLANENTPRIVSNSKIHAYLKLSEGCNQTCSFCAIPHFKGKLYSRTLQSTLKEITNLAKKGFSDFSFIAQDTSSYLLDLGQKDGLVSLVQAVDLLAKSEVSIRSARIMYLYPSTTSLKLIQTIGESPIFANYFDMPLQHSSNKMLKVMNRHIKQEAQMKLLESMRKLENSFIRTSFIIGHPSESEKDFLELCSFIESFAFDRINFFAYSDEEGTASYEMSNKISIKEINARLKEINKIFTKQQKVSIKKMLHKEIPVIIEGKSREHDFFYSARDCSWAPEIDGEILINETQNLGDNLTPGYYLAKITQIVGNQPLGCALRAL